MEVAMKLSIRLFLLTTMFCLIPTAAITMESLPGQVLGIYGGPGDDMGYKIANAPDGGFLLCGTTESFGNSKYDIPDILAIRVDSQGRIVWQKDFGGTGGEGVDNRLCEGAPRMAVGKQEEAGEGFGLQD